jgi:hypothetical protein
MLEEYLSSQTYKIMRNDIIQSLSCFAKSGKSNVLSINILPSTLSKLRIHSGNYSYSSQSEGYVYFVGRHSLAHKQEPGRTTKSNDQQLE